MARRFVLFGSGDGGEWADHLFRNVAGVNGHAAVVATAQVANGPDALAAQRRYAEDHLGRAGIRSVQVPLLDRADAEEPAALEALDGGAFVYVLGGQLPPLVAALRGSRFWDEVTSRQMPYVGNSAGAMLFGGRYPTWDGASEPGLGVFPAALIVAHWDEMDALELIEYFLGPLSLAGAGRDPRRECAAAQDAGLFVTDLRTARCRTEFYDVGAVACRRRMPHDDWDKPGPRRGLAVSSGTDLHRPRPPSGVVGLDGYDGGGCRS